MPGRRSSTVGSRRVRFGSRARTRKRRCTILAAMYVDLDLIPRQDLGVAISIENGGDSATSIHLAFLACLGHIDLTCSWAREKEKEREREREGSLVRPDIDLPRKTPIHQGQERGSPKTDSPWIEYLHLIRLRSEKASGIGTDVVRPSPGCLLIPLVEGSWGVRQMPLYRYNVLSDCDEEGDAPLPDWK
ncbi:hypothetical protein L1987_08569 [Smallanthus sonchifolius]|uniref:Uncharacterized protein n=1 Tax=Smallanthus sonchifolius TaxID=185202 RepID=A0ACB9JMY6_9ASTR|nr:hypothetical protein L1987_08569 [Smallanthus sonchifolius]